MHPRSCYDISQFKYRDQSRSARFSPVRQTAGWLFTINIRGCNGSILYMESIRLDSEDVGERLHLFYFGRRMKGEVVHLLRPHGNTVN